MTKRSYHPTDGRTGNGTTSDAVRERRAAIEDLGDALRTLLQCSAATEAGADDLRAAPAEIRRVTGPLAATVRTRHEQPTADDLLGGIRMYNPVSGAGSGLAPPVDAEVVDGVVVGTCTLGLAYEGPPTYAHGGVSALLLDHM